MGEDYQVMDEAKEFYFPGNKIGVLVIHGFTGSTQSMRFLGKQLADAKFTVYGPRLTGHGTAPEDMENASCQDWIETVEWGLEKLKETCSAIFVTGLSMGGTLTLYLAERHSEIKGIMPINAAVNLPEFAANYEKLSSEGIRFMDAIGSDIKKEGVEELAYPKTPVKSIKEIVSLTDIVRNDLQKINTPALIFSSVEDHVVPPQNAKEIYESISSKERAIVSMENSYHVATLDHDKELIAEKCIAFINKIES
ncbi:lipase [Virgibacillus phasianinus]|uniref:Lipase n=1 Tax=Virgibacillus phasianinus TaxID=2017483 RepID=A0A220U3G9_9BACI|nr:alpha/beta fold hydrolase [Virgibacillus phasianinus]ASK62595.1 lipase [Virgibacillus phasianinus]